MQNGLIVTPKNGRVALGGTLQFSAAVTGLADNAVDWSVEGNGDVGSISEAGLYTAPNSSGTFQIVAKSRANAEYMDAASVTVAAPQGTPPTLQPGVWTNLTPPGLNLDPASGGNNAGVVALAIDPGDPRTIYIGVDVYAGVDSNGLWKTTDGGTTWTHLGGGRTPVPYTNQTDVMDSATNIVVDPTNSDHLYMTQGVRGSTVGFWVSNDGGLNWTRPQGFMDVYSVADVTAMQVDPTDFNHVILGSHFFEPVGIMESMDGGETWTVHPPPDGLDWGGGSYSVLMLFDPATNQGDSKTWLVNTNDKFLRTTDGGETWTNVGEGRSVHGFVDKYYAKDGTLYVGSAGCPYRSRDNGVTWEEVGGGLPCSGYQSVVGDGDNLYTLIMNFYDSENSYWTASESTGDSWAPYKGGAQTFNQGSVQQRIDRSNRIIYTANLTAGFWALKLE